MLVFGLVLLATKCQRQEFTDEDIRGAAATALFMLWLSAAQPPACTGANLIILTSIPQLVKFAPDHRGAYWGFVGASITSGQNITLTSTTTNMVSQGLEYPPNNLYVWNGSDCNATPGPAVLNCVGTAFTANCQVYSNYNLATLAPAGSYRFSFSGPLPDLQINK